ncbi:ABC transporter ATP-binding protein [Methylobacterium nodulans]|uniref:ABC transporter ATP-binding protein n=1 Tax=Methylobacterium nodulans TaxID=114616 RepID=UPI001FCB85A2|nr:ABC transporter ATP-binding protein [Methylobacterium nodulans]
MTKAFGGVVALQPCSFTVPAGAMCALLGPSGCGKTTTLRIVAGFELPNSGRVLIGGEDKTYAPPQRRRLGMVFQSYALFPHMTVAQNVAFGLRMAGLPRAEIEERTRRMLDVIRLPQFADRHPAQLSGGQQQRVALARALVTEPSVLLLDEPLGALDKSLREQMQFEIRQLQQRLGITTLIVTHDQEEALTMSDLIVVMSKGRILQVGTPTEVYERPKSRFVSEFLGTSNILACRVRSQDSGGAVRVGVAGLTPEAAFTAWSRHPPGADAEVLVAIRPEHIHMAPSSGHEGITGFVDGQITGHVFRGATHVYQVAVPGLEVPFIVYQQVTGPMADVALPLGTPVALTWPEGAARVVDATAH